MLGRRRVLWFSATFEQSTTASYCRCVSRSAAAQLPHVSFPKELEIKSVVCPQRLRRVGRGRSSSFLFLPAAVNLGSVFEATECHERLEASCIGGGDWESVHRFEAASCIIIVKRIISKAGSHCYPEQHQRLPDFVDFVLGEDRQSSTCPIPSLSTPARETFAALAECQRQRVDLGLHHPHRRD